MGGVYGDLRAGGVSGSEAARSTSGNAENLCQEVLLSVAQSVSQWVERDNRGSFHAWLLRIAHNEAVDMLSQRATRSLGKDGEQGQKLLDAASAGNDISSLIEREYERELFRLAADRVQQVVSPQTWQAFRLTEVEGQSVPQAAEALGTTTGHIYVSRSRVMARIKEFVKEYEARQ